MEKRRFKFFPGKLFYLLSYLFFVLIIGLSCTGYPTQPENLVKYKVVFDVRVDVRNYEIATINGDGSELHYLTDSPLAEQWPKWSPDGTQILYNVESPVGYQIYIMNSDGSNQHRLLSIEMLGVDAEWSPDGNQIAFTSREQGVYNVFFVNTDGSSLGSLKHPEGYDQSWPNWSPDGNKIVLVRSKGVFGTEEIYVMNLISHQYLQLTSNSFSDDNPVWSPDGKKIVFTSFRNDNSDIYIMNQDGSEEQRLTNDPEADLSPVWSLDGEYLLYNNSGQIWKMKPDGSEKMPLTSSPGGNYIPDWSSDGEKIVFVSSRDAPLNPTNSNIYIMNANGTSQKRLTNNPLTKWSPSFSPVPMY